MSETVIRKRTFPSGGIWALVAALGLIIVIWIIFQQSVPATPTDTMINTGPSTNIMLP